MPTNCHNCRRAFSLADIAAVEADPKIAAVVKYFGQMACLACCDKAGKHNRKPGVRSA